MYEHSSSHWQPAPLSGYDMHYGPFQYHTTSTMALDPGMYYYLPRHAPFFALPSSRKRPKTADNNEYVISRGSAPPRGTPGTTPKHVDGFDRNYVCTCRAHRYRTPTMRMAPDTTTLTTSLYHHRTASMLDTPTMKGLVDVSTINSQSTVSQSQHNRAQLPSSKKPAAVATKEDMRRAGIHAGYCCKNWDPSEAPLILLGSVFDANSFGKWVYDWTVFHEGPTTPLAEMAGELWLLPIQLAGKTKQAFLRAAWASGACSSMPTAMTSSIVPPLRTFHLQH